MGAEATADGPPRRRTSWSLKTIVEDVAGRPIGELQDPARPVHPYLKGRDIGIRGESPAPPRPLVEAYDPVDHLYPPLIGSAARAFHGPDHENHAETLDRHRPLPGHIPGPSHRPERLYLHYLLLHMDRLSGSALRYLKLAVDEELAHRAEPPPLPSESSHSKPPS
ncbi:MAG: hypothetical protein ABSA63_00115 [Thermoplasmata archaeon]